MATWFGDDYCRDLAATRAFYVDALGLKPVWDESSTFGVLHDNVQLVFTQADQAPRIEGGWAFQPGWAHGPPPDAHAGQPVRSTSIAMQPAAFRGAVRLLQERGDEALRPEPFSVGYRSYVVRDPNGRTVELSDPETPGPGSPDRFVASSEVHVQTTSASAARGRRDTPHYSVIARGQPARAVRGTPIDGGVSIPLGEESAVRHRAVRHRAATRCRS